MNVLLRRSLIAGGLAALVARVRPGPTAEALEATAEASPRIIDVPHAGPWRVYSDRIELVPRWDLPEVTAGPQPAPLSARLDPIPWDDGTKLLTRTWAAETAHHCRLCPTCNRCLSRGGTELICHVVVPTDLAPAEASLYQTR